MFDDHHFRWNTSPPTRRSEILFPLISLVYLLVFSFLIVYKCLIVFSRQHVLRYRHPLAHWYIMPTNTWSSQTGDTAVSSRTSTPAIPEKPNEDASSSYDHQAMEDRSKGETGSGLDDAPTDAPSTGGFTLLMTVTALALSMFLVRLHLSNRSTIVTLILDRNE